MKTAAAYCTLRFLTLLMTAFCLAEAIPLDYKVRNHNVALPQLRQQKSLRRQSSLVGSISSTTSGSFTSTRQKAKSKLKNLFKPTTKTFTCEEPDPSYTVASHATSLTKLLEDYRDQILEEKSSHIPSFKVCMGGWSDELKPSIYFQQMTRRQLEKIERLLGNIAVFRELSVERIGTGGLWLVRKEDRILPGPVSY